MTTPMSEGSVSYNGEGATCGIFTVINSELKNHLVCDDGLACMDQHISVGSNIVTKKCSTTLLPRGTICNPLYTNCFGGVECLRNEFEIFTCGGSGVWGGNSDAIDTTIVTSSLYERNMTMVILGIILLLIVAIIYMMVFVNRQRTKSFVIIY